MEFIYETDRLSAPLPLRFSAYILDIIFTSLVLGLGIGGLFLTQKVAANLTSDSVKIALNVIGTLGLIAAVLWVIWARWLRVLNQRSTLGMNLLGLEIECAQAGAPNNKIPLLFWMNIGNKEGQSPAGDMDEQCMDSQLGKGTFPYLVLVTLGMVNFVIIWVSIAISRLILIIENIVNGRAALDMFTSRELHIQDIVVASIFLIPSILIIAMVIFGFLFALGSDRRTLADHFFGVRLVRKESVTEQHPQ